MCLPPCCRFLLLGGGLLVLATVRADDPPPGVASPHEAYVAPAARTDDAPGINAPQYRELPCRVVDERGAPVRDTQVILYGVDRFSGHHPDDDEDNKPPSAWAFTTDHDGRFTVRFGQFEPLRHYEATKINAPGFGEFHLIASKGDDSGVSRLILNYDKQRLVQYKERNAAPEDDAGSFWGWEWRRGEFAPFTFTGDDSARPLVIVLKRGLEVRGQMVDDVGRPLPGVSLRLTEDIHVDTHTGYGGEIFPQTTVTDEQGRFRFEHVYPNVFTVDISGENRRVLYWYKTQVRGRWTNRIEDEIAPETGGRGHPAVYEKRIRMRIVAAHEPPYRYFGRVTDQQGHGVAGLEVSLQSSVHSPALTYGDDHGSQTVRTDAQGRYSIKTGTRFVNWIFVNDGPRKLGELPAGFDGQQTQLAPGRHDFKVTP